MSMAKAVTSKQWQAVLDNLASGMDIGPACRAANVGLQRFLTRRAGDYTFVERLEQALAAQQSVKLHNRKTSLIRHVPRYGLWPVRYQTFLTTLVKTRSYAEAYFESVLSPQYVGKLAKSDVIFARWLKECARELIRLGQPEYATWAEDHSLPIDYHYQPYGTKRLDNIQRQTNAIDVITREREEVYAQCKQARKVKMERYRGRLRRDPAAYETWAQRHGFVA